MKNLEFRCLEFDGAKYRFSTLGFNGAIEEYRIAHKKDDKLRPLDNVRLHGNKNYAITFNQRYHPRRAGTNSSRVAWQYQRSVRRMRGGSGGNVSGLY